MVALFKKKLGLIDLLFYYNLDVFLMYFIVSIIFIHRTTGFHINFYNFCVILTANMLGVMGIYIINKISDKGEDSANGNIIEQVKNNYLFTIAGFFFLVAGFLYLVPKKPIVIVCGIVLFLLGTLYSFPKKYRLKKVFLIKNLIPAFCWFLSLSVLIFASTDHMTLIQIMKLLSPLLFLEFIFEIIWDLPDTKGDRVSDIKTLPVVIGFVQTKILLGILAFTYLVISPSVAAKVTCLLFIIFILLITEEAKKRTYRYFLFTLTLITCLVYSMLILHLQ